MKNEMKKMKMETDLPFEGGGHGGARARPACENVNNDQTGPAHCCLLPRFVVAQN